MSGMARCGSGYLPSWRRCLEPEFGSSSKEPGAVALDMIAELDRATAIGLDQLPQQRPALQERAASQVLAVEVGKVEGKEHERRGLTSLPVLVLPGTRREPPNLDAWTNWKETCSKPRSC
jgi:hypothetical protein